MMTLSELRALDEAKLHEELQDLRKKSMHMRFQKSMWALEDTSQLKKNRVQIAQIKTVLREKKHA